MQTALVALLIHQACSSASSIFGSNPRFDFYPPIPNPVGMIPIVSGVPPIRFRSNAMALKRIDRTLLTEGCQRIDPARPQATGEIWPRCDDPACRFWRRASLLVDSAGGTSVPGLSQVSSCVGPAQVRPVKGLRIAPRSSPTRELASPGFWTLHGVSFL